ncbi:hypothetical protein VPNG_05616 [Cytospora leucostoma]|uniref:F-box domain-containing protein n=1 Tax=Cytospora leucostoma TaxID=1230097 RepID=A0A423X758_9PEZI|nr:hypothetical protein VPNG_05616 [Cytospora leucostoma]
MSTPVLRLPLELRVAIYDLVVVESEIVLPGPIADDVSGLVLASKQTRLEVLPRLWRASHITWQGTVTSTTWRKFKKVVLPQIRNLTIVVNPDPRNGRGLFNEYHRLLLWMCRRCKPSMRAKYDWKLQRLTLRDIPRNMDPQRAVWSRVGQRWMHGREDLRPYDMVYWSSEVLERYSLGGFQDCGVLVTLIAISKDFLVGFGDVDGRWRWM